MTVHLRPCDPQRHLARMVELYNMWASEPQTVEQAQVAEARTPAGQVRVRAMAEDDAHEVVGYYDAWHHPWNVDGKFQLEVVVDPARRHQGIGTQLYDAVLAAVCAHGAALVEAKVWDHDPGSLYFAERRGFTLGRHIFESTLDLASFDELRFAGAIERQEAAGIHFLTLADLGDTEAAQRKLYALNRAYVLDIPGSDGTFALFEEWHRFVCEAEWYDPAGQLIALAPGAEFDPLAARWIGMTAIGYFRERNSVYQMITGVDPAWRGRGLALALKLLNIRRAQTYGAAYIRTNNDSLNAPMLAINRKLGFRPEPGFYKLQLAL